mmetsp:Transcript_39465/g.92740  ORF Transcript_39465/g.92740 Transcript_39465/m.92740 type:complete len:203 (+) Transcript_39465:143-751(+)
MKRRRTIRCSGSRCDRVTCRSGVTAHDVDEFGDAALDDVVFVRVSGASEKDGVEEVQNHAHHEEHLEKAKYDDDGNAERGGLKDGDGRVESEEEDDNNEHRISNQDSDGSSELGGILGLLQVPKPDFLFLLVFAIQKVSTWPHALGLDQSACHGGVWGLTGAHHLPLTCRWRHVRLIVLTRPPCRSRGVAGDEYGQKRVHRD